ncbi:TasA family protein [Cytobacillus sp. IB215316]|uniref:TasA family protein n=1 Tax=Cytobacillus sp. IB215316 TaxID=3097354 RepID=UPI002A0AAB33|nr:TasA family protein [Cytobacillus sp. IB215316]MDX8360802.1 TasA family protein [Cytobacillus sp. IB215316]
MKKKTKLGLAIGSLIMGISLLGGTFAFITETEEIAGNKITAGNLDLLADPSHTALFKVSNLLPGEQMTRTIELSNIGTLDIQEVLFDMNYELTDANPIDTDDSLNQLDEDLKIEIRVDDELIDGLDGVSLLAAKSADEKNIINAALTPDDVQPVEVEIIITYEDNNNQNHQKGDSIDNLVLSFDAKQADIIDPERANDL